MRDLQQDIRYAARMLARTPGFTAAVVATLALAIGANTAIFSVVEAVLLRPLPFPGPGRLMIAQTVQRESGQTWATSPPDYALMRSGNATFERLAAFYPQSANLSGHGDPERVLVLTVSSNFFGTLGVAPKLGRDFVAGDERWGEHRVAILSDGLWRRRLGASPSAVGAVLRFNEEPYQIVGIAPEGFALTGVDAEMFTPMSFAPGDNLNTRNNYFLTMLGRLRPGVARERASADLDAIMRAIEREHPENKGLGIAVTSLLDAFVGDVRPAVLVLMGAVALLLAIGCANVANLLLARAVGRRREVAIRTALGASRRRLLQQFFVEGLTLAALGCGAGLLLASWAIAAIRRIAPAILPRVEELRLDPTVLAFTLAVSAVTGLLFELAPALRSTRAAQKNALAVTHRVSEGKEGRRLRGALVISEVALSLVLLVAAGLLLKSLHRLLGVRLGFEPSQTLTAQLHLSSQKYVDRELERQFSPRAYAAAARFFDTAVTRIATLPGVGAAGAVSSLPLSGETWGKNAVLYDRPIPSSLSELPPIQYRVVAGDYFRAAGIRILRGRAFTRDDTVDGEFVAIVNEMMARRYWKGVSPIGKVLSVNPPRELSPPGTLPPGYVGPEKFTIVGVAEDALYGSPSSSPPPLVYVPYAQGAEGDLTMFLVVRSAGDPLDLAGAVREQIRQIDPEEPVSRVATLDSQLTAAVARPRLQTFLLGAMAALALVLAAFGIYGVLSYAVSQETRSFGIRLALGALPVDVTGMVLKRGLRLAAIGLAIGSAVALAVTRFLRSLLFAVSPTDPAVFGTIVAVLVLIALAASLLPARRAARVDPAVALRSE
jgi:putative ABC transport system permease protein